MRVRTVGDIIILEPQGDLTTHNGAREISKKVEDLIELGHKRMLLDLSGVIYADIGGIEALLAAYDAATASGGRLRFSNPKGPMQYLLSMTKLSMDSAIYQDERKAIASFV
jgi:anti-anti-sigma factor